MKKLFPSVDFSTEAFPFMGLVETEISGIHAKLYRISFSGELAYEVNVESNHGLFMWNKIMKVGEEFGIQPYGTEALATLRIEMGHVAGPQLDGRAVPYGLGLQGMVSQKRTL